MGMVLCGPRQPLLSLRCPPKNPLQRFEPEPELDVAVITALPHFSVATQREEISSQSWRKQFPFLRNRL